jgi:TonB family protein
MTRMVIVAWCLVLTAFGQDNGQPVLVNGSLLKSKLRIAPLYPRGAKAKGLKGKVFIRVVIGSDGRVEKTELKEGNRELAEAAMDAMRFWTYEPYISNGQPVRVQTIVIVHFK